MDSQTHKPSARTAPPLPEQRRRQPAQQQPATPAGTAPAPAASGMFGSLTPLTIILAIAAGAFAAILLSAVVGVAVAVALWNSPPPADPELAAMIAEHEKNLEPEPEPEPLPEPPTAPAPTSEPEPDEFEPMPPIVPEPQPKEPRPPSPSGPFKEVCVLDRQLPFPVRKHNQLGVPKPVELATILVDQPQQCDMSLVGLDHLAPPSLTLSTETRDEAGARELKVTLSGGGMLKPQDVGSFILEGQKLRFEWGRKASNVPIQYCLLRLTAPGNETVLCHLGTPQEVEPIRLTFDGVQRVPRSISDDVADVISRLPVRANEGGPPALKVKIWPEGFPKSQTVESLPGAPSAPGIVPIGRADIHIFGDQDGTSIFDIEAGMSFDDKTPALNVHLKKYYFAKAMNERTGKQDSNRIEARRYGPASGLPGFPGDGTPSLIDLKKMCDRSRETSKLETTKTQRTLIAEREILADATKALDEKTRKFGQTQPAPPNSAPQAMRDAYQRDRNNALGAYRQKVATYGGQIREMEQRLQNLKKLEDFAIEQEAWCDQMKDLMGDIEANGSIHFRVYYELEGEEIELVRTKKQT